jgi:hypothetical protein
VCGSPHWKPVRFLSASWTRCLLLCSCWCQHCCSKIAEAEAAVSINEKKWLVMHSIVAYTASRGPVSLHQIVTRQACAIESPHCWLLLTAPIQYNLMMQLQLPSSGSAPPRWCHTDDRVLWFWCCLQILVTSEAPGSVMPAIMGRQAART